MRIRLRLFAALREQIGAEDQWFDLPDGVANLSDVRAFLRAQGGAWAEALDPKRAVRGAVNQRMAQDSDRVADGDEIAFFPPVTGG